MIKLLVSLAALFVFSVPSMAATKKLVDWTFESELTAIDCVSSRSGAIPCHSFLGSRYIFSQNFGAKFTGIPKGEFPSVSIYYSWNDEDGEWRYCDNFGCGAWGEYDSPATFSPIGGFIGGDLYYGYPDSYHFSLNESGPLVSVAQIYGGDNDSQYLMNGDFYRFTNFWGEYVVGSVKGTITSSEYSVAAVPLPPSAALLSIALIGIGAGRLRRKSKPQ